MAGAVRDISATEKEALPPRVHVPTLLIVGGQDDVVADLNRRAMVQMRCRLTLEIVPGATHLSEEPGCLDHVFALAIDWFRRTIADKAISGDV